jgi:hypothetical protein
VDNFTHHGTDYLSQFPQRRFGLLTVFDVDRNHLCFTQNRQRHARDVNAGKLRGTSAGSGDETCQLLAPARM